MVRGQDASGGENRACARVFSMNSFVAGNRCARWLAGQQHNVESIRI